MAGRRQKTNAEKTLAGNPGKRSLVGMDLKFTTELGNCPDFLSELAKKEWKRVVKDLKEADIVRAVDMASLAAYCQSYARWQQAEAHIAEHGLLLEEPIFSTKGELKGHRSKRNPAVSIAKDERAAMRLFGDLFGLDPLSRARITVPPSPMEDALERLLSDDDAKEQIH